MNGRLGVALLLTAVAIGSCGNNDERPTDGLSAPDTIYVAATPPPTIATTVVVSRPAATVVVPPLAPTALVAQPRRPKATKPIAGRCTQYEALLAAYSPGWDVLTMSRLMYRESRCTPTARNRRTHDWGALQVHWENNYYTTPMRSGFGSLAHECGISSPYELLDVRTNVRCAAVLYRAFRYRPWGIRG